MRRTGTCSDLYGTSTTFDPTRTVSTFAFMINVHTAGTGTSVLSLAGGLCQTLNLSRTIGQQPVRPWPSASAHQMRGDPELIHDCSYGVVPVNCTRKALICILIDDSPITKPFTDLIKQSYRKLNSSCLLASRTLLAPALDLEPSQPRFSFSTMAEEDATMMDVDEPTTSQATLMPTVTFVRAPASADELKSVWNRETSNQKRLIDFLTRWPPSRTPFAYGPWILADRGGMDHQVTPNFSGLASAFESLVASNNVTVEAIDQISQTNNVLVGKWMVFEESSKIDMLWGKILYHVCVERQRGFLKVSTRKEGEKHVICVYVQDYTNKQEVSELRKILKSLGVKWKIGFKTDAYTHLNIYKDNPWNIRPSRYHE